MSTPNSNELRRSSRIQQQISTVDRQTASTTVAANPSQTHVLHSNDTAGDSHHYETEPLEVSHNLAEALRESTLHEGEDGAAGGSEMEGRSSLDCAICLQPCVHPAKLPCSHIFCFLCLKGFAQQSRRCAMCRTPIPHDYLERPELVQVPEPSSLDNGYQWFYEGRNGWWQYDDRTSADLELNYQNGERLFELLIAGNIYMIDFNDMVQYRKVDPVKKRRIKRDMSLNSARIKGIAGLRLGASEAVPEVSEVPALPEQNRLMMDHNYSLIPVVPLRRARIQSSILGNRTDGVWYADDPVAASIDDSSRHDHFYTRREALEQLSDPNRFHHLVRQGSVLNEIFHLLRFAFRDVRHLLSNLRNRFLPWRISVRTARRLELASFLRSLLVTLDIQVMYPLFLEFSRLIQERLRISHQTRQDEFLVHLNNDALEKARLCARHSVSPDYVNLAQTALYRHGDSTPGPSGVTPRPQAPSVQSSGRRRSTTSSSGEMPRSQAATDAQTSSTLEDLIAQMYETGTPDGAQRAEALFLYLAEVRIMLNTTLLRIDEERENETPMEREEENYFLSFDTWSHMVRMVQMVLGFCGVPEFAEDSASEDLSLPPGSDSVLPEAASDSDSVLLERARDSVLPQGRDVSNTILSQTPRNILESRDELPDLARDFNVINVTSVQPDVDQAGSSPIPDSRFRDLSDSGYSANNCHCPTCSYGSLPQGGFVCNFNYQQSCLNPPDIEGQQESSDQDGSPYQDRGSEFYPERGFHPNRSSEFHPRRSSDFYPDTFPTFHPGRNAQYPASEYSNDAGYPGTNWSTTWSASDLDSDRTSTAVMPSSVDWDETDSARSDGENVSGSDVETRSHPRTDVPRSDFEIAWAAVSETPRDVTRNELELLRNNVSRNGVLRSDMLRNEVHRNDGARSDEVLRSDMTTNEVLRNDGPRSDVRAGHVTCGICAMEICSNAGNNSSNNGRRCWLYECYERTYRGARRGRRNGNTDTCDNEHVDNSNSDHNAESTLRACCLANENVGFTDTTSYNSTCNDFNCHCNPTCDRVCEASAEPAHRSYNGPCDTIAQNSVHEGPALPIQGTVINRSRLNSRNQGDVVSRRLPNTSQSIGAACTDASHVGNHESMPYQIGEASPCSNLTPDESIPLSDDSVAISPKTNSGRQMEALLDNSDAYRSNNSGNGRDNLQPGEREGTSRANQMATPVAEVSYEPNANGTRVEFRGHRGESSANGGFSEKFGLVDGNRDMDDGRGRGIPFDHQYSSVQERTRMDCGEHSNKTERRDGQTRSNDRRGIVGQVPQKSTPGYGHTPRSAGDEYTNHSERLTNDDQTATTATNHSDNAPIRSHNVYEESHAPLYVSEDDSEMLLTSESTGEADVPRGRLRASSRTNRQGHCQHPRNRGNSRNHENPRIPGSQHMTNSNLSQRGRSDSISVSNDGVSRQSARFGNTVFQEDGNTADAYFHNDGSGAFISHCTYHELHSSYTHACPMSDTPYADTPYDLVTYAPLGNTVPDAPEAERDGFLLVDTDPYTDAAYQMPDGYQRYSEPNEYLYRNVPYDSIASSHPCAENRGNFSEAESRARTAYDNFGFEDILSHSNLSFNAKVFVPKHAATSGGTGERSDDSNVMHSNEASDGRANGEPSLSSDRDKEAADVGDNGNVYAREFADSGVDSHDRNSFDNLCDLSDETNQRGQSATTARQHQKLRQEQQKQQQRHQQQQQRDVRKSKKLSPTANRDKTKTPEANENAQYAGEIHGEDNGGKDAEKDEEGANGGFDETGEFDEDDAKYNAKNRSQKNSNRDGAKNGMIDSANQSGTESRTNKYCAPNGTNEAMDENGAKNIDARPVESLTINDHNYAATTKHQPLTRQDSEHSYACKKLKSSRTKSVDKGENRTKNGDKSKKSVDKKNMGEKCAVNTEHAYSKHSEGASSPFDHEYAKAWNENLLVDQMNYLTLQESEEEDDDL
ncbi:hypothetical protein M8J76_016376 [Diaphorina citri]|nr:hypothetical protein M8J76_016376 [Diaphorina citri]